MKLIIKGFTTKHELKALASEARRLCVYTPANIYLEADVGPLPNDGTFIAEPLGGRWSAMVSLRNGQIMRVR